MKILTELRTCSVCFIIYETHDPMEKEEVAVCSLICARTILKDFRTLQSEVDSFIETVHHFLS